MPLIPFTFYRMRKQEEVFSIIGLLELRKYSEKKTFEGNLRELGEKQESYYYISKQRKLIIFD